MRPNEAIEQACSTATSLAIIRNTVRLSMISAVRRLDSQAQGIPDCGPAFHNVVWARVQLGWREHAACIRGATRTLLVSVRRRPLLTS